MRVGVSQANSQIGLRDAASARIPLIGFLCINCGVVILPVIYGTVLPLLEERSSSYRTAATGLLSAMLLTFPFTKRSIDAGWSHPHEFK